MAKKRWAAVVKAVLIHTGRDTEVLCSDAAQATPVGAGPDPP